MIISKKYFQSKLQLGTIHNVKLHVRCLFVWFLNTPLQIYKLDFLRLLFKKMLFSNDLPNLN